MAKEAKTALVPVTEVVPAPIVATPVAAKVIVPPAEVDPLTVGATPVVRDEPAPKQRAKLNLDDATNYHRIIRVVAKGNPKKPGSQAATDFLHYRDGMTLLTYLNDERMPRRRARANVQWDLEHGFIRLEEVKGAEEAKTA